MSSIQIPFEFNRNEKATIMSPDFLTLPKEEIDTEAFIDSGIVIGFDGNPLTLTTERKWFGIVIEPNYYDTSAGKLLKPSGNVEAYFGNMRIATKQFTEDATSPIVAGDVLTVIEGKFAKMDADHTIPIAEVIRRESDYIEIATI